MREVREIIGKLNSNIKTKSRKGYLAIVNTAARLKSKTRDLTDRFSRISKGSKNR